jgi:hypothetical protein
MLNKKITFKKVLPAVVLGLTLSACSGDDSPKVASLQKKDKSLSCSEVQLEINEAEFYRKTAETNKSPKVKSLLMPLGYISTYVNAEEASDAASARIEYLNRIYDILKCDDPSVQARVANNHPYGESYESGGGGAYAPNQARFAPMSGEPYYRQSAPQTFQPISAPYGGSGAYGYGYEYRPARPETRGDMYW